MAKFYITEFADVCRLPNSGAMPFGNLVSSGADQTPVVVGSEAKSAAFAATTKFIRVHTDAICSIAYSPTAAPVAATTANARMAANSTEYFAVNAGDKLSVIANT